jgi:hypothetical protein
MPIIEKRLSDQKLILARRLDKTGGLKAEVFYHKKYQKGCQILTGA